MKVTHRLKQSLRRLSHSALFSGCVGALERLANGRKNNLSVLTYHRVAKPTELPFLYTNGISATPAEFEWQIQQLVRRFEFVGIPEVIDAIQGKATLPPKALLLTFDDGYQDFRQNAWPILRRHRLPVVLFVPTAFPGNPGNCFWWDRLANAIYCHPHGKQLRTPLGTWSLKGSESRNLALRQVRDHIKSLPHARAMEIVDTVCVDMELVDNHVLSWDDLRLLADDGVTLGAHTRTHPMLNRVSVSEAVAEAVDSLADLRNNVGATPRIFAYPAGGFNDEIVERLRTAFDLAFTTCRGVNEIARCDPMRIRRINVSRNTSHAAIRAQMLLPSRLTKSWWPISNASDRA